jgi:Xaa-Pro aminopeptidase
MIREKIEQTYGILEEMDIDLWLIFVRESKVMPDPALELVVGTDCTWQSAFAFTRTGKSCAIVGNLDEAKFQGLGYYDEVRSYVTGIRENLVNLFKQLDPAKFALNVSRNDYMSDGLTYGMYQILMDHLAGTPYADRWVSSEKVMAALRGRKSATEQERIAAAIALTEEIYAKVTGFLKVGRTEKEVAAFILKNMEDAGVDCAWAREECPAVFTGPEAAGAHCGPTDRPMEPGHIMNIDFGVKKDDYCSDIQRTWYFLREGETEAPEIVQKAFKTIVDSIRLCAEKIRPGMTGLEVDTLVRKYITDKGFPEFPHATGHQVGRSAHDGAATLAPAWERYGEIPFMKIEEGQVYTIEPRIPVEGHGVATSEEIIVVTKDGGKFLSHPQKDLFYIK